MTMRYALCILPFVAIASGCVATDQNRHRGCDGNRFVTSEQHRNHRTQGCQAGGFFSDSRIDQGSDRKGGPSLRTAPAAVAPPPPPPPPPLDVSVL